MTHQTIASVLRRLGIDPATRIGELDQDAEYTACRTDELPAYFQLYKSDGLSNEELAVLCCFLLETMNDCMGMGSPHPLQEQIMDALFDNQDLHAGELAYWMDTSDPDPEHWWPITKTLLERNASA